VTRRARAADLLAALFWVALAVIRALALREDVERLTLGTSCPPAPDRPLPRGRRRGGRALFRGDVEAGDRAQLGLRRYADHLRRVRASGYDGSGEDVGDRLDGRHERLSGAEAARARAVAARRQGASAP